MKKIALSLATVLAAAAFAPEASAVPVFARQTGMACTACHFQHFPLLNGFGRAFKAAGYTMMGAQEKVEGEALSIPDRVNMGVFTTTYYQNESQGVGETTANVKNAYPGTHWGVPGTGGELSLFIGGRVSDFAGFLMEAGLGGGAPIAAAGKLAILFPVGDARLGAVIHSSNGQGVAYSFELLNTGAANTHKMMGNSGPSSQHVKAAYASQYLATNTPATGISLVANNSMGFAVLGAYEQAGNSVTQAGQELAPGAAALAGVGGANGMGLTYVRLAGIQDVAGWDVGYGLQNFGGKSTVTNAENNATVIDVQAQGEVAGMATGVYASYGTAAASKVGSLTPNTFNNNTASAKTSFNVAAELGVIPHEATVQAAVRFAKTGAAANNVDNAIMLGATYELAQNMGLSLTHTMNSGSAWDAVAGVASNGKTATTLLLETLF